MTASRSILQLTNPTNPILAQHDEQQKLRLAFEAARRAELEQLIEEAERELARLYVAEVAR